MPIYYFLIILFCLSSNLEALTRREVIANALKYNLSLSEEQQGNLVRFYRNYLNEGIAPPEAVILARLALQDQHIAGNPRHFARLSRMLERRRVTLADQYALFRIAALRLRNSDIADADAAFYSTVTYVITLATRRLQASSSHEYQIVDEFPIVARDEPEVDDAMPFLIQDRVRQFPLEELRAAERMSDIYNRPAELCPRARFLRAMAVIRLHASLPGAQEDETTEFFLSLFNRLFAGLDWDSISDADYRTGRETHLIETVLEMRRLHPDVLNEALIDEGVQIYNRRQGVAVTPSVPAAPASVGVSGSC